MLKKLGYLVLASLPLANANAFEDAATALQGFEAYSDILPGESTYLTPSGPRALRQKSIIPAITSVIPEAAAYNIQHAEQVFCYQVSKRPANYTGYTLSSFAITGFCGELDTSNTVTAYEALFTQGPNIIPTKADCRIEPRIMLRFARGVDYTDVLLSLPCPSFTVFYGGKYKSFNIKQGVVTDLVSQFEKNNTPFNSPTLLKQTVANGVPTTDAETAKLEKKQKENAPLMKWKQKDTPPASSSETPAKSPQKSGWSNIKLRK